MNHGITDLSVVVVSPFAYTVSHSWQWTIALARALRRHCSIVPTVVAYAPSSPVPQDLLEVTRVVGRNTKAREWNGRLLRLRATVHCGILSLRHKARALHFVDASLGVLILIALVAHDRRITYNVWGAPPANLRHQGFRPMSALAWLMRKVLNSLTSRGRLVLVCETQWTANEWSEIVTPTPLVVGYAVEDDDFLRTNKELARKSLGIPREAKVLLFFGTHRDSKNYDEAIKAARTLPSPPLLFFAGRVTSSDHPLAIARRYSYSPVRVDDRFIPEEEIPIVFSAADGVVLPYGAAYNRGSGVLLEACRFGIPIIASRSTYLEWFSERYSCVLLYEAGNVADLRNTILSLLTASESRRNQMRAGAQRVINDNSWNGAAESYAATYISKS